MPRSTSNSLRFFSERYPAGLEYLSHIDKLLIEKVIVDVDLLSRAETENKYIIRNCEGEQIFYAVEDTYCGRLPYDLQIFDNYIVENIRLSKKKGYYPGIKVFLPLEKLAAIVETKCKIFPKYIVKNPCGESVLKIKFPFICKTDKDVEGTVFENKEFIGSIRKRWSKLNMYEITFPKELAVEKKVALVAVCFLIQATFFRDTQEAEKNARHTARDFLPMGSHFGKHS
ncbi:unnamed protein product [Psylliodes chrysocephalus]|uniref:Phospholipid scramblase n=1 Tax=Psylliodes chrysocephalus TaxID=3402493 RepID=A0A9P0D500_9CUCU|nr:unnamed protein product [Psylliodes chrysocephala]